MNRMLKAILLLFAVGLLAGGAYVLVVLWPWLAGPGEPAEQIERRYEALERWANFPPARKSSDELEAALDAVEKKADAFRDRLNKIEGERLPSLDAEALGPEASKALKHLLAWAASGAGLANARCPDIGKPLSMLSLGRLALATAPDDATHPQVRAVLKLAAEGRRHGLLIHQMVGWVLAEEAIQWCRMRKLEPGPAFREFAPQKMEVYSGLVRESLCMVELSERELTTGDGRTPEAGSPFGAVLLMDRELLWIKKYNADRFEALRPVAKDFGALAAGLKLPEKQEDLPPSFLIRLSAPHGLPGLVQRMARHYEAYDKLINAGGAQ